ncbi:MAG: hypothetical protein BGO01_20290 [Armatimonadetes bacterium 55-13]|nr:MAG: hypothetical protein BGO01_20290 [Armatimonadetes bacterium 55-13]
MRSFVFAFLLLTVPLSTGHAVQSPSVSAIRTELTRTDTQWEVEFGRAIYDEILRREILSHNPTNLRRTDRVFSQILSALPDNHLYTFQINLIASNSVNASATAGGYMFVEEGLLTYMPDDNALAFVFAHELGHAVRRHMARQLRRQQSDLFKRVIVAMLAKSKRIDEYTHGMSALSTSREFEDEADAFATELYLRAGFDPKKVTLGLRCLQEYELTRPPNPTPYLERSHPYIHERISAVDALAKRLLDAGLKPYDIKAPDLTIENVFGKIPTLAPLPPIWMPIGVGFKWQYQAKTKDGLETGYTVSAVGVSKVGLTNIARMSLSVGGQEVFYQAISEGDRLWRRNRPTSRNSAWNIDAMFPGWEKAWARTSGRIRESPWSPFPLRPGFSMVACVFKASTSTGQSSKAGTHLELDWSRR